MTSSSLYRWSGLALVLGAVIGIVGNVLNGALFPSNANPRPNQMAAWTTVWVVCLIGQMLILTGLPGLAVRQEPQAGKMGFLGFVLTFFGGFLLTSFAVLALIAFPWLEQAAPAAFNNSAPPAAMMIFFLVAIILFAVGGVLLGLSVMRAGVFPRAAGVLLVIGAVLNAVGFPLQGATSTIINTLSFVVFAAGLGWMGFALLQEGREVVGERRLA